jgi:2,4-dienoyl-CoA reductase-like NADH-dependent reductase (Old Yellow Enzyme family)
MQRPWYGNGPLNAEDIARGEKTWDIVAPTAEPMADGFIVPRQLSVSDLAALKGHWVDAAKRALEAGFEVLEIHNAHGYLMHTFLSPLANKRNDAYGGDFAGRTRFPLEVAEPCAPRGPRTSRCSCACLPSTAWTAAGPWTTRWPTQRSSRRAAST